MDSLDGMWREAHRENALRQPPGKPVTRIQPMPSMGRMRSFTLHGKTYEYLMQGPGHPEATRSWEYGNYPKVLATLTLAGGGTIDVYAVAERWNPSHILVTWQDDDPRPHSAWIPTGNVARVNDSDWDIEEYRRCPEDLRRVRWGNRLPGFLPA